MTDGIRNASEKQFNIQWIDGRLEPKVKPNPDYPEGIDIVAVRDGEIGCHISLPYPAKRIGVYSIECILCGFRISITTAGRPDDPRSISVPCKIRS